MRNCGRTQGFPKDAKQNLWEWFHVHNRKLKVSLELDEFEQEIGQGKPCTGWSMQSVAIRLQGTASEKHAGALQEQKL